MKNEKTKDKVITVEGSYFKVDGPVIKQVSEIEAARINRENKEEEECTTQMNIMT